jgi:glutamyl-tRNA reductase
LNRARELAQRFDAEAVLLSEIPDRLIESDIVIASTASQLPILGKGAAERALKARKHKPILMVDIAVPRDIEPQVGDLADIYLYTVDDLKDIIDQNKRSRESEARKADSIIEEGVNAFRRQQRSLDVVSTLKAYRSQAEVLRDSELEKAMRQLENGSRPEEVLCNLARGLTNKLIHTPSVQMKKASAEGRSEMIAWTHELLGLSLDADDSEK